MLQFSKGVFANLACALTLLAGSTVSVAAPVTIDYALTSLAAPGRYQYSYTVTNVSLATPVSWFSVDFDPALYDEGSLLITSAGLGNWSEQLLASIPILGVPAQYDAYKTSGSPLGIGDSEFGFTIEFTWLGTGTPGSQAFTVVRPARAHSCGCKSRRKLITANEAKRNCMRVTECGKEAWSEAASRWTRTG